MIHYYTLITVIIIMMIIIYRYRLMYDICIWWDTMACLKKDFYFQIWSFHGGNDD